MKRLILPAIVLIVLLVAGVAGLVWLVRPAAPSLSMDHRAELEAVYEDLAGTSTDSEENAWPEFEALTAAYQRLSERVGPAADPSLAAKQLLDIKLENEGELELAEAGRQMLNAPELDELDRLLDKVAAADHFIGPIELPTDWSAQQGAATTPRMEQAGASRGLARLQSARSMAALAERDFDYALLQIERAIGLSVVYAQRPDLMARLMSIAMRGLALSDVRRVAFYTNDRDVLERLEVLIDAAGDLPPVMSVYEGERLMLLATIADISVPAIPFLSAGSAGEAKLADEFYDRLIAWSERPAADRTGPSPAAWLQAKPLERYPIVGMLGPSVEGSLRSEQQMVLYESATRAAVAVCRYMLDEGVPPPTIEALVPRYLGAVPSDPFRGEGLVYRPQPDPHTGAPFTLYSVGHDGVDDGGLPSRPRGRTENTGWDESFTREWIPEQE